jgi:predicted O-methyltransferase YrrM
MASRALNLTDDLVAYVRRYGVREHPTLVRLRDRTAPMPNSQMQIGSEQGAFMALLVKLIGAKRILEIGTFTGYSSLIVALAMPPDGTIVCCDVSEEWTSVARRYWAEAGVADRVDLRLAPALETLDELLATGASDTFDFAFVDARKTEYPDYHERVVQLLRPGGLVAYDNVLWSGRVADDADQDADTQGLRRLNDRLAADERVTIAMLPIADGVTLARKR